MEIISFPISLVSASTLFHSFQGNVYYLFLPGIYFIHLGLYFNSGAVLRVQHTFPNMESVAMLHKNSNKTRGKSGKKIVGVMLGVLDVKWL